MPRPTNNCSLKISNFATSLRNSKNALKNSDDLQAGRIVVGLMSSVFLLGLLMYAFICWLVM